MEKVDAMTSDETRPTPRAPEPDVHAEYRAAWDTWAAAVKAREPVERCKALWRDMNAALDRLEATTMTADEYARRAQAFVAPEPSAPDDLQRQIRVAINDPSRYVLRRQDFNTQETLAEWQARAVMDVLRREGLVK